jgi:hypothetical protein
MVEVTILLKVVLGIIALTVLLKAPLRIKRDRLQGCRTGIAARFASFISIADSVADGKGERIGPRVVVLSISCSRKTASVSKASYSLFELNHAVATLRSVVLPQ